MKDPGRRPLWSCNEKTIRSEVILVFHEFEENWYEESDDSAGEMIQ